MREENTVRSGSARRSPRLGFSISFRARPGHPWFILDSRHPVVIFQIVSTTPPDFRPAIRLSRIPSRLWAAWPSRPHPAAHQPPPHAINPKSKAERSEVRLWRAASPPSRRSAESKTRLWRGGADRKSKMGPSRRGRRPLRA